MTEQFTPVTCRGKDGKTVVVQGETTPITAVYLTPYVDFDGPRYTGDWCLTHAPTGRCFPYRATDVDDILDLAELLATVADDWTEFPEDGSQWPDDVKAGLARVVTEWQAQRAGDESILFVHGGAA
jgi:hypothetical protein